MFKGKKSIYILVPLNLFIWSYMGYKIYSAFHEDDPALAIEDAAPQIKLKAEDSISYILNLKYKDPFLKDAPMSSEKTALQKNTAVAQKNISRPVPAAPEKKVPDIKYLGLIENKTSGLTAGMVSVNGSSQVIKPGQTIGDVIFQTITPEFIVIKIGKEKMTIQK